MSSNASAITRPKPFLAALLNVGGLGLGYLYLERWRRWLVHALVTAALITAAFVTNAAQSPALWLTVFGLWLLWMVVNGWVQGQRATWESSKRRVSGWWYPAVLSVVLLAQVTGLWVYAAAGQQTFAAGMAAYQTADCATAVPLFSRMTTLYRLTLSPNVLAAPHRIAECDIILPGQQAAQSGAYEPAVTAYETYLGRYPNEPAVAPVMAATDAAYIAWADQLRQSGQYADAVEKYQTLVQKHPETMPEAQSRAAIAETYVQWADDLRKGDKYAEAIEKYGLAAKSYGGTPTAPLLTSISDTYAEWAVSLRTAKNFPVAIEKYQVLLKDYPTTTAGKAAAEMLGATYAEWASDLRKNGKFQEALDTYQALLKQQPDTTAGKAVAEQSAATYAEWAASLRTNGKFQDAIDKYQVLSSQYPGSQQGTKTTDEIAETYSQWAARLRGTGDFGDFSNALDKYQILLDKYPDTLAGRRAQQLMTDTYSQWASSARNTRGAQFTVNMLKQKGCSGELGCKAFNDALIETYKAIGPDSYAHQNYIMAIEAFAGLKDLSTDPDTVAMAEKGYNDAMQALGQDTGSEGQDAMNKAVYEVKSGKSASYPIIGTGPDQRKASGYAYLPDDLKAEKPADLYYVIAIKEDRNVVETCRYTNSSRSEFRTLSREQPTLTVTVRATRTGGVVNERTFYGSVPNGCPDTYLFGLSNASMTGSAPASSDIVAWLRGVIR